jgi:nucleoside-diphosphate-sugar epimerase
MMTNNPLAADLDHIIEHTRDLWDELRGERFFITGGTGFFGCWLLESFLWANERLNLHSYATILTRRPHAFVDTVPHLAQAECITLLEGDIRSFSFPAGTFSQVIHAATEANAKLNADYPLMMLDTIVDGTRHMLDFASQCGAKNFLLTSSGAVYGKQPTNMTHIPEEYLGAPDPLDIKSAYGEGKRMAEHICAQYAGNDSMQPKIARCFAFVGPYLPLDTHFAIGNFIRDSLNGGPIEILGDGSPHRSYLYASDLAIWLWTILFRGKSCQPYNVGSEFSISMAKLAKIVANKSKPVSKINRNIPVPSVIPGERYVPSTFTAHKDLDLLHWIDLDTAIEKTIHWYLEMSRR